MPVGLFGNTEKHVFEHAERIYPIYFSFAFQRIDDITVELPLGWKVTSLPEGLDQEGKAVAYVTSAEERNGTLHLTRKVRLDLLLLDKKFYTTLRAFFQMVRTGDEQQIVLQPGS